MHVNLIWRVFGRNRTGYLRITIFLKCRALHHWAMVTDELPKILQDPLMSRCDKTVTFVPSYWENSRKNVTFLEVLKKTCRNQAASKSNRTWNVTFCDENIMWLNFVFVTTHSNPGPGYIHFFEHIELPAKLLDYFLRSNKSNINRLGPTLSPWIYSQGFYFEPRAGDE